MAIDYATLKTAIKSWAENQFDGFDAQIDRMIANAELRIIRDSDLRAFRKYDNTLVLTAGSPDFALPSDCVMVRYLKLLDAGEEIDLVQKDDSFVRTVWPDPADTDVPMFWAYTVQDKDFSVDNDIRIAPTPDLGYPVRLSYKFRPTPMSAGNTTTWLGNHAENVLLYACMIEAALFNKQEGLQWVDSWKKVYDEALTSLRVEEHTQRTQDESQYGEPRA